jgi:hypothetical protein
MVVLLTGVEEIVVGSADIVKDEHIRLVVVSAVDLHIADSESDSAG